MAVTLDPSFEKSYQDYRVGQGYKPDDVNFPGNDAFVQQWMRGVRSNFKPFEEWSTKDAKPLGGPQGNESLWEYNRRVYQTPDRLVGSMPIHSGAPGGFNSVRQYANEVFNPQSQNAANVTPASNFQESDAFRKLFEGIKPDTRPAPERLIMHQGNPKLSLTPVPPGGDFIETSPVNELRKVLMTQRISPQFRPSPSGFEASGLIPKFVEILQGMISDAQTRAERFPNKPGFAIAADKYSDDLDWLREWAGVS